MKGCNILWWCIALVLATGPARAAFLVPDDPDTLRKTTSLGQLLARKGSQPVHVVYVHGMRAEGVGASSAFRAGLCRHVSGLCSKDTKPGGERHFLSLGPRPSARYVGAEIWRSDAEWEASRPFVDRYLYPRASAPPVIVDEVNWWPLLFPPKCRLILVPETNLAGQDADHLRLCARGDAPYHAWLSEQEVAEILARRPLSGGGALLNKGIKLQIMNWGLSDAVLALGPLREYFRKAMSESFDYAAQFESHAVRDQEFVVISESLGSFVVLDAFQNGDNARVREVGERAAELYFFANQFALLELARIELSAGNGRAEFRGAEPVPGSPSDLLHSWASSGVRADLVSRPKQIIAFSDASDLLTYPVPRIQDDQGQDLAWVVNVYDRNEIRWFGLVANPVRAHTGHSSNNAVLGLMLSK